MLYAHRIKKHPELNDMRDIDSKYAQPIDITNIPKMTINQKLVIVVFFASFVVIAVSVVKFGFYMDEMCIRDSHRSG